MQGHADAINASTLGSTERRDMWWAGPLAVAASLAAFVVYATWRAFESAHYEWGPYLSPFYSPKLPIPSWWPEFLPRSPAFLIVWAPAGFRATCYYFRKAYYRAYFMDPPACAVSEGRGGSYRGETAFPLILQNLHRYFLYAAILLVFVHWYDTAHAFRFDGKFGVGAGSLIMLADAAFLSFYVFSCHAFRHLVGGGEDCYSSCTLGGAKHRAWSFVSRLNLHHMFWAWVSLFMVGFADFYVRMLASGAWTDMRLF
jgi:hypothetical protein